MKTYLPCIVFSLVSHLFGNEKAEKFSQGTHALSHSLLCLSICFLPSIWGNDYYFHFVFLPPHFDILFQLFSTF